MFLCKFQADFLSLRAKKSKCKGNTFFAYARTNLNILSIISEKTTSVTALL